MKRCWPLRFAAAVIGSATLIGVCLIGAWIPAKLGYCLNITPSEPVGIYQRVAGGAQRGALVLLNQPRDSAASILGRHFPANIPLIKRVAAREARKMAENKKLSADISESGDQPRAILVRFAPKLAARVEADAHEQDVSPTEIVRSIICEHYGRAGDRRRTGRPTRRARG